MRCFVYIVRCADRAFYTGITWDLRKRVSEHNSGLIRGAFTRGRTPVRLVYWEEFNSREEAAKREKEIKGWSRVKKENLIVSLHRGV